MNDTMKLKESIPSNSVKIIDLYNKIDSEILDTSPDFQRKLVWKKQHKYSFIGTILMNYPFPEVYIASTEMDVEKLKSKEIVVDGKQRLTAIVEYIKGINDFKSQNKVKSFEELTVDEKREFLNYLVTVKDLKDMGIPRIKEIFQRINSTEYALNIIERTNAQFGDGEFAVFCKQIIDIDYNPTNDDTDIVLQPDIKTELNNFFLENNIFNENDKSRMFDNQFIMLIISTFLEGDYYSRSSKINDYLEKYNSEFGNYEVVLNLLLKTTRIISNLGLAKLSYWFNKANLFTLIIELSKINAQDLDLQKLENKLLELETKVDIYFSKDDFIEEVKLELDNISEEEKKYFEFARQGSHERLSRIHRGKLISELIKASLITSNPLEDRMKLLKENNLKFVTIQPTKTGLEKSIMDATLSVREFLKSNGIHDYEIQQNGSEHKIKLYANYILDSEIKSLEISLYRANNRGDARIWFTNLSSVAKPNDIIAIVAKKSEIYILNITQLEIENLLGDENPLTNILLNT